MAPSLQLPDFPPHTSGDRRNKQSINFLLNSPAAPAAPVPRSSRAPARGALCRHCGGGFADAGTLRKHVRAVHEGAKDFACGECGYRCAERSNLKKHIQARHEQSRPHRCGECDKSFSFSDGLRRHVNNCHLKLRPHACSRCPATFKQRAHLQAHCERIHGAPLAPLPGVRRGPRGQRYSTSHD